MPTGLTVVTGGGRGIGAAISRRLAVEGHDLVITYRAAQVAATIPMGRAGRPEEIAGAVAWLLSEDASYATGTTIRITGGL